MKSSKLWMGIPLIITVLTVLFAVILTSCDQPIEDDMLVGTWKKDEGGLTVEFTSDHKLKIGTKIYYYTTSGTSNGTKLTVKNQENDTRPLGETAYDFPSDNKLSIVNRIDKLLAGVYTRAGSGSGSGGGQGEGPGGGADTILDMPVADPNGGSKNTGETFDVTLTAATGAIIYYTLNGNNPTTASPQYANSISITSTTAATITLKAYAAKTGMMDSDVMTAEYIFTAPAQPAPTAATPTATPNGGSYLTTDTATVILTSATVGATIYYTLDGNVPTVLAGTPYATPISISSTTAKTITIKAIAVKEGMTTSGMFTSAGYVFDTPPVSTVATPTATPVGGSYFVGDTVSVTLTAESGASIYYTLNGTAPTASSTPYTTAIPITSSTSKTITLKAIAVKGGISSNVLTEAYAFASAKTVTSSDNSGTGTLRNLITGATDGDIIRIGSNVTTILLDSQISIGKNVTIEGNGVIITPSTSYTATGNSLFLVSEKVTVNIRRVHFKSGKDSSGEGSGIYNRGYLTLESCIFTINSAVLGGAINNRENTTTVKGCTFYTNSATTSGGAIYNNSGTLTLTGNLFFGNTAPANKGPTVFRNGGTVTSGGYNVSDTALVEVASGSWTGQSTDKTFTALGITFATDTPTPFVDPATDNFAPKDIATLKIMPSSAISGFPITDFNGRERYWPGMPGAIR